VHEIPHRPEKDMPGFVENEERKVDEPGVPYFAPSITVAHNSPSPDEQREVTDKARPEKRMPRLRRFAVTQLQAIECTVQESGLGGGELPRFPLVALSSLPVRKPEAAAGTLADPASVLRRAGMTALGTKIGHGELTPADTGVAAIESK